MPDSPDEVSGWPCLITRLDLWNTATDEIHGRQTPCTMWGNSMMDGPLMMDGSSLTFSPWSLVHEFPPTGTKLSRDKITTLNWELGSGLITCLAISPSLLSDANYYWQCKVLVHFSDFKIKQTAGVWVKILSTVKNYFLKYGQNMEFK